MGYNGLTDAEEQTFDSYADFRTFAQTVTNDSIRTAWQRDPANSNYQRDSAWLALGFDETHFEDDFPTQDRYGDRPYQTDSATYKDWEKLYEAMPEDKPRFSFLVSIQSHGDYDMNDASLDIVHAATTPQSTTATSAIRTKAIR